MEETGNKRVEVQSSQNVAVTQVSSSVANGKPSGDNQGKVVLCQGSQLLVSFAGPRGDSSIILLRGNLDGSENPKEPKKLTINLNPVNKVVESPSSSSAILKTQTSAAAVAVLNNSGEPITVPSVVSPTYNSNPTDDISDNTVSSTSSKTQQKAKASTKDKSSSGDSICVCSYKDCGRSFSSMALLSYHRASHRTQAKRAELACDICKINFAWPSHHKYHMLTHMNKRAFQCYVDGCGKRFYTMQRLDVHLRTHTGEKPFACSFEGCGKSFTTKGNLRNHQRIHTGEKPFKCTFEGCNSAFAESSSLRKHGLVHSGEKPFACEFCDKAFSQIGSRNIHMNKNHGARKQQALAVSNAQAIANNATVIDSGMVVESPQNILVLTTYDDRLLQCQEQGSEHVVTVSTHNAVAHDTLNYSHSILTHEESLQTEVDALGSRSNVVVLSQPEELVSMGEVYQSATHEEIVYDNDILNSAIDQEQIAPSSISIQQDLEGDSNESHAAAHQMMVSILDASTSTIK